jgi:hypothetical protein
MTTKSTTTKTTNDKTRKPRTERANNLKSPKPRGRKSGPQATEIPNEPSELLGAQATSPRRRGGKSTGRKPSQPTLELPPAEPGQGASRLRNSVNSLLAGDADRLAFMLFSKAIAGNIPSARLLVELSGANKPPAEKDEESDCPSVAAWLASQPCYVYPDNLDVLQLPSGEIFVRQSPEDSAAIDPSILPFGDPKLLPTPKPDGDD